MRHKWRERNLSDTGESLEHWPNDWWTTPNAINMLTPLWAKHVVGLRAVYVTERKAHGAFFTGFIFQYKNMHVWLSAGHVVEEMDKIVALPRDRVFGLGWIDGVNTTDAQTIPMSFDTLPRARINRDGLDLGVVWLRENTVGFLLSRPDENVFLNPTVWGGVDDVNPDGFHLAGAPTTLVELNPVGRDATHHEFQLNAALVTLPVERIPREPKEPLSFWSHPHAFYGRLVNSDLFQSQVPSIKGMSGGPVFALSRVDAGIRYHLVGIQSAWLPQNKTIRATPVADVAEILQETYHRLSSDSHMR